MNQQMEPLYTAAMSAAQDTSAVPEGKLADVVDFDVEQLGDAILLKGLADKTEVNVTDFANLTDYECFVNQFRVQDYLPGISETWAIRGACDYAAALNLKLVSFAPNQQFRYIIASGPKGCVFRFHQIRLDQSWSQGSAGDGEAILALESSDLPHDPPALVTIASYRELLDAELAKTRLESAGIRCWLADDNMVRLNWFYSSYFGGVRVQVPQDEAEDAAKILAEPAPEGLVEAAASDVTSDDGDQ